MEPLGEDWGKAEMAALLGMQQLTAAAVRKAVSNADPAMAQLRKDAAIVQHACAALPEGEHREALLQHSAALRREAEAALVTAQLQPTTTRAGKVVRRQQGRPEGQRKVTALFPGRTSGSKRSLMDEQAAGDYGDEFEARAKSGRRSEKVRAGAACAEGGDWMFAVLERQKALNFFQASIFMLTHCLQTRQPTRPGNINGTTQRCGKHRRVKRKGAGGSGGG